jgi:hypothetical protein
MNEGWPRENDESKGHSFLGILASFIFLLQRSCKQLFQFFCFAFWSGGVFSELARLLHTIIKEGKKPV